MVMTFLFLCLVLIFYITWNNSSAAFLFKTQCYQWLHGRHVLIVILMISSSTYSRCHIVCGYLHYSFILMIRQKFSRGTTRTRDELHTRQRDMGSKWMQSMILGLHILFFFNQPPPKNTPTLDYHRCMLNFLLCLIPCVATSISVTLIIFTWAQNLHINHS